MLKRFLSRWRHRINDLRWQEFVPPGHYYSALLSKADRLAYEEPLTNSDGLPGICLHESAQLDLLQSFLPFYDTWELCELQTESARYHADNIYFTRNDAFFLSCMMRHYTPSRIIEVGCGFSSALMLDVNEKHFGSNIQLDFIDPDPKRLKELMRPLDEKHTIHARSPQKLQTEFFLSLKKNDILFIDSTHVCKPGSDLHYLLFKVLPELNDGVLIHFHDIFWPFEYPQGWIREKRAWNEIYLLHSFLQFNEQFSIVLFGDFLYHRHQGWLQNNMPRLLKGRGGSLWLKTNRKPTLHNE